MMKVPMVHQVAVLPQVFIYTTIHALFLSNLAYKLEVSFRLRTNLKSHQSGMVRR